MARGEVKQIEGKRVASAEYRSWQMMKNRCLNLKATDYAYYGGRGVLVDARWMEFDNFLRDMGRKPTDAHTLDRIDNNGHYWAGNCRWATRREQAQNRTGYNVCNQQIADMIRAEYATGNFHQWELAEKYGLTQAHISQITRNVAWPPRETEGAR